MFIILQCHYIFTLLDLEVLKVYLQHFYIYLYYLADLFSETFICPYFGDTLKWITHPTLVLLFVNIFYWIYLFHIFLHYLCK
jgi:hypothetical protein